MSKRPTSVSLRWTSGLAFHVETADARTIVTDGNSGEGLSPVELLAAATASCMAVDLVHILTKGRQPVERLSVSFTGERAQSEPHRLTAVRLEFTIEGAVAQAQVDRAIQLSRDKYCSVWNSLREDTTLEVITHIHASAGR